MKISKSDWKFVGVNADPDFSPEHNKRVMDEVLRKNAVLFARKERERKLKAQERSSAIASYVKNTHDNSTPEEYFGRKHLTYLRGQQIVERLKNATKQE